MENMIFNRRSPQCPQCGMIVDYLINRVTRVEECEARLDGEREITWGDWYDPEEDSVLESEYVCPHCKKTITNEYEEVLKLLSGKDDEN